MNSTASESSYEILDRAFDSSPYQTVTGWGPLKSPMHQEKAASAGSAIASAANAVGAYAKENLPSTTASTVSNAVAFVNQKTRVSRHDWNRAVNGLMQGITLILVSLATRRVLLSTGGSILGVLTGAVWAGIAVRQLSKFNEGQHKNNLNRVQWVWQ